MSRQYAVATSGAFGFVCLATTAVLFVLKLIGAVQGSWWLVFAPLLAWLGVGVLGIALVMLVWVVGLLIAGIVILADRPKTKKVTRR